ncbi:uncharacterized protein LOC135840818 isoform X9 [Planococcus citri]|uniref:uncharacterized protein LOC135840818 isoform X9 n=1 Tax=Planococcus citri TaxID=170843 RepID=UPI0031F7AA08
MAETLSNDVYDILFPSPPDLKEIAAIAIAVELWRQEINAHRIKNTLNQLDLQQNIISNASMPNLPTTILSLIEKYVERIGSSIGVWLKNNGDNRLFKKEIFNDFIDFAADFDGSIHSVRTARRLVLSDRIDNVLKFEIACTYCFEDDILRIWPLVSTQIKLRKIGFYPNPVLYYWVCKLKNQFYKMPRTYDAYSREQSIEERVIDFHRFNYAWSTVEYFWNRLDVTRRIRVERRGIFVFPKIFCRYLLSKFNEIELDHFVNKAGYSLFASLLRCDSIQPHFATGLHVRATWTIVKHMIRHKTFNTLIVQIIKELYNLYNPIDISAYCELWNTAPDNLKPPVCRAISRVNDLFDTITNYCGRYSFLFEFLSAILSDPSVESKNIFWNTRGLELLSLNLLSRDEFVQLLSLSFDNDENLIIEFKQTLSFNLETIRSECSKLFKKLSFEELNNFLNFCCLDEQTSRNIRQSLLPEKFELKSENITNVSCRVQLHDFINDAFNNPNLAASFKTLLLSSSTTVKIFEELNKSKNGGNFLHIVRFIDTFAPSEEIGSDLKRRHVFSVFERMLRDGSSCLLQFEEGEFLSFLRECLGNDDRIAQFKDTLSVDQIVQNLSRYITTETHISNLKYCSFVVQFLEWYFVTPQALDEFKSRYADDDEFVVLITK